MVLHAQPPLTDWTALQVVAEWTHDLDHHGGAHVHELCAEGCNYRVGGTVLHGPAEVAAFYTARNERVRADQRNGVRTQRHTVSNARVSRPGESNRIDIDFILVNYSAEGAPPVRGVIGPSIIADCAMQLLPDHHCRSWRIGTFASTPVFIGDDPFLNAAVLDAAEHIR